MKTSTAGKAAQKRLGLLLVIEERPAGLVLPAAVQTPEAQPPEFGGAQVQVGDGRREGGIAVVVAPDREDGRGSPGGGGLQDQAIGQVAQRQQRVGAAAAALPAQVVDVRQHQQDHDPFPACNVGVSRP